MHNLENCVKTSLVCINCSGYTYSSDKNCPRYVKEAKVIKIKTIHKITHVQACCRLVVNSNSTNQTSLNSSELVKSSYDS